MKKPLIYLALAALIATPILVTAQATVQHSQDIKRIFVVKNTSGALVGLQASELDTAPTLTRLGNAKSVQFAGRAVPVEITIVIDGNHTMTIDRYTAHGDSDE